MGHVPTIKMSKIRMYRDVQGSGARPGVGTGGRVAATGPRLMRGRCCVVWAAGQGPPRPDLLIKTVLIAFVVFFPTSPCLCSRSVCDSWFFPVNTPRVLP